MNFLGQRMEFSSYCIPWDFLRRHRVVPPGITPSGAMDPAISRSREIPDRLWRYNLNYFDFLFLNTSFAPNETLFLIIDWIARNDDEHSEPWEPYVVSRRIRNWVRWLHCPSQGGSISPVLRRLVCGSIYFQLRRLFLDIEFHIQGNHLLENFAALFIGAICLQRNPDLRSTRKRAASWIDFAAKGLIDQIDEQILPDGAHYELSPMYHIDVLHTLRQVNAAALLAPPTDCASGKVRQVCERILPRMQAWLEHVTHPDGGIPLFNDCTLIPGALPTARAGALPGALPGFPYATPPESAPDILPAFLPAFSSVFPNVAVLGSGIVEEELLMPESGYFVKRWGNGNFLLMDAGDPQPSYQSGHSHCDALSFELSVKGRRLVVDTGTGSYDDPRIRNDCRCTAAHNVPLIEGSEQSEIWGSFRMGRRSRVEERTHDPANHALSVTLRDFNGNRFHRLLTFSGLGLEIVDSLLGHSGSGAFASLLHLHPDVRVSCSGDRSASLAIGDLRLSFNSSASWELHSSRYFPDFGKGIPNCVIRCQGKHRDSIKYSITWSA